MQRCLEAAGASFADVCKVTVYYRNIADREAVNRVRQEFFGSTRPASTAVEVSRLVNDDLLVEIEVVAVRPPAAYSNPLSSGPRLHAAKRRASGFVSCLPYHGREWRGGSATHRSTGSEIA